MKTVNLTITLDGPIPAVTKQDIAEQGAEKLKKLDFTYSVISETPNEIPYSFEEINQEPVSSDLHTFGDIDSAMKKAHELADSFKQATHIGRPSEEQGGSRVKNSYSKDRDPLNEG